MNFVGKRSQIEIGTVFGAKLVRQDGLSSAASQKNVYASVVQFFLCNLDLRLPFTCSLFSFSVMAVSLKIKALIFPLLYDVLQVTR